MLLPLELLAEPLPLHAVWTTTYSRANSVESQLISLRPGADGTVYLWCRTQPDLGGKEGSLAKMDAAGQTLWELHLAHASAWTACWCACRWN
jgi:hypothetical protein